MSSTVSLSLTCFFLALSTTTFAVSINFRNFSATAKPSTQNIQSHLDRIGGAQQHNKQPQLQPAEVTVTLTPAPLATPEQSQSTLCNITVHRKLRHTWLEAFRACKNLGSNAELVSIQSEEDYLVLTEKLNGGKSPVSVVYWTSGTDLVDEGVFVWMSDGSGLNSSVTNWGPSQPDNLWETEHCVALRRSGHGVKYQLSDENCLMSGAFICAQRC